MSSRLAEDHHAAPGTSGSRLASAAPDALCIAVLFAAALWIFGADSDRLGIYADDPSFFVMFSDLSPATLLTAIETYVTGRNLHILWQYGIFVLTGNTIEALTAQHWLEAFMVALNCGACYTVFRLVGLPVFPGFLGAALFAFMPNHPEVYFWLTAIPQHLISTFLVLLMLIGAIRTGWIAPFASRRSVAILLGVDLCILVAGVLTYDQVVMVMVAIFFGVVVTCFTMRTDLRLTSALYGLAGFGIFAFWAAWKVLIPSFGPSISNVTPFWLARNLLFSLSLAAGPHFFRVFDQIWPTVFAWSVDRYSALAVALSFLVVGLIILRGADNRIRPTHGRNPLALIVQSHPTVLLFGIALFFVLAYGPAYLWYISFRHTYLPSVAVAGAAAWVIWHLNGILVRVSGSALARSGMAVTLLVVCTATYYSVGIVLAEKRDWIWSYQVRKQMYAELARDPRFHVSTTLILADFPDSIRPLSAPLGYQVPGEPTVMTRGSANFTHVVQTSAPTRSGSFIQIDADRDGGDAFLHVPEAMIYRVYFKGLSGETIQYSREGGRGEQPDYRLEDARPGDRSDQADFRARRVSGRRDALALTVPSVVLEPDEVLAASPLLRTDTGLHRMTALTGAGAKRLVLVDLSADTGGAARRLMVIFDHPVDQVAKLQIYAVSARGRRLIADFDVSEN